MKGELAQRFEFRDCILSEHCDLPSGPKIVLLVLDSFRSPQSPVPWPSQATLCRVCGMDPKTLRNALMKAAAMGWLSREERRKPDGSRTSDMYRLHIPPSVLIAAKGNGEFLPPPPTRFAPTPLPVLGGAPLPVSPPESFVLNPLNESTGGGANGNGHSPTWLSPFAKAFKAHSGTPNFGLLGKVLKPICDELGADAALNSFQDFLTSPQARFGVNYFGQHWQDFRPMKLLLDNGELNPDAVAQAARRGINL